MLNNIKTPLRGVFIFSCNSAINRLTSLVGVNKYTFPHEKSF